MKRSLSFIAGAAAAAFLVATGTAHAHIKMLKPAPWLKEDNLGGPQKGGPCGPGNNSLIFGDDVQPVPTNGTVTTFKAGETISVEWTETIGHPGYFRVALAENRADLKDPTHEVDGNCNVKDRSKILTGAHDNVLADGILIQANGGPARPGAPNFKHQVTLPNKPCEKCTLQLIQFMENHPPGCIYYHCADIKIVAAGTDAGVTNPGANDAGTSNDASTVAADAGGTTSGGTTSGTSGGTTAGTTGGTTSGTGTTAGGGTPGGTTVGGMVDAGTTTTTTGATAGTVDGGVVSGPAVAPAEDDDGGCSVAMVGGRSGFSGLGLGVLALGLLARRRRRAA